MLWLNYDRGIKCVVLYMQADIVLHSLWSILFLPLQFQAGLTKVVYWFSLKELWFHRLVQTSTVYGKKLLILVQ